jgi:hypothetical protein
MSVGERVAQAIGRMDARDPEGALFQICAAVEVTARREYGGKGGAIYRQFVHENLGLITKAALGPSISNLRLAFEHPEIERGPDGRCSVQEIVYHAVRCGLYHEAGLPPNLKFTEEQRIRIDGGTLYLPASLVYGLIVAVISCPANKDETAPAPDCGVSVRGFLIPLGKLWGKRAELLALYQAMDAF